MAPKRASALLALPCVVRPQQCVAYGRVSTDKQREEQTIDTQVDLLLGDINARDPSVSGRNIPESEQRKLVGQYWDDGVTGTDPLEKRPEGKKLVRDICHRGDIRCQGDCGSTTVIDSVWITKLDRLARKLQVLIDIESFFRAHGVALRCLEFNIDTSDRNGKLMFHILGVIAEWERETILERTDDGRITKVKEGKNVGGRPTFGFKTENGYLVVDETLIEFADETKMMACDVVRAIFENIALNGSTAWREAEKFGLTQRKVLDMIHNPRYRGEGGMYTNIAKKQKGAEPVWKWIPAARNNPPALVSPELWNLAQDKLKENQSQSARNRQNAYLLSSLLICCEPHTHIEVVQPDGSRPGRKPKTPGMCGRLFLGRTVNKAATGRTFGYYYCSREGKCSSRPLRQSDVEKAVWDVVAAAQRNPEEFISETMREVDHTRLIGELRQEIVGITESLAELEGEREVVLRQEQKKRITEDVADARHAEIDSAIEPLQLRKQALERQLFSVSTAATNLRRATVVGEDVIAQIDAIEAMCQSDKPEQVRKGRLRQAALIKATVERGEVRVGPGGENIVRLYLRFGPELPVELPSSTEKDDNAQQPIVIVRELVIGRPGRGGAATPLATY